MDFSHYSDEPVKVAVALVNTFEAGAGVERLRTVADLAAFIGAHEGAGSRPGRAPTRRDLDAVRELRSRLRLVFAADDPAEAVGIVNGILADVGATPRVSLHGSSPHLHIEPGDAGPAQWLGAVTAMGLSVALIEGGLERLGTCASSACDDVFVDTSRNRSRRHCSDTCTTRENVAAYRKRRRAAG